MRILALIADLADVPDEQIAVALAEAIFHLEEAENRRLEFCVEEAETIRVRLNRHGFDIVSIAAKAHVESPVDLTTENKPLIFNGGSRLSALSADPVVRRTPDFVDSLRCAQCDSIERRDHNWVFFHDSVTVNAEGTFTKADLIHIASHLSDDKLQLHTP